MIQEFLISIFTFFIVDPARAAVDQAVAYANVPPAVVAEAKACVGEAAPRLAARAWSDPWWGVTTVVNVTFGTVEWRDAVVDVAPRCATALDRVFGGRAEGPEA